MLVEIRVRVNFVQGVINLLGVEFSNPKTKQTKPEETMLSDLFQKKRKQLQALGWKPI